MSSWWLWRRTTENHLHWRQHFFQPWHQLHTATQWYDACVQSFLECNLSSSKYFFKNSDITASKSNTYELFPAKNRINVAYLWVILSIRSICVNYVWSLSEKWRHLKNENYLNVHSCLKRTEPRSQKTHIENFVQEEKQRQTDIQKYSLQHFTPLPGAK